MADRRKKVLCPKCGHHADDHGDGVCWKFECGCELGIDGVYYIALAERTAECERLTRCLAQSDTAHLKCLDEIHALRASLATAQEDTRRLREENMALGTENRMYEGEVERLRRVVAYAARKVEQTDQLPKVRKALRNAMAGIASPYADAARPHATEEGPA